MTILRPEVPGSSSGRAPARADRGAPRSCASLIAQLRGGAPAIACAALVAALASGACSSRGSSGDRQGGALKLRGGDGGVGEAVPVEVATLQTGSIEAVLHFSTNLTAERQVQIVARAGGLVNALRIEEGDDVKRGQVVLQLEDEQQRIALARVKADLARARRELDRQKSLHARGVVSDQALQAAEYDLERLELAQKDAALALRYSVVRAPFAGTITRRVVKRGDTVAVGQPLFELTDFDSLVAQVFVPEKQLSALRTGLPARISGQARPGEAFSGTVARIAPTVDPKSGTVKTTIAVPRAEGLMPGMFAEVDLVVDTRQDAVLLPKRALVYDNEVPYAFVVVPADAGEAGEADKAGEHHRVERRRVDVALDSRDHIEPQDGFRAGDRVVVAGQVGLKDGALVEVAVVDGDVIGESDGASEAGAAGESGAADPKPAAAGGAGK